MASKVRPWLLLLLLLLVLVAGAGLTLVAEAGPAPSLDDNYVKQWGAGFRSKSLYGSGFFHVRMKVPSWYTTGVVMTFYVDFEFLGDKGGVPVTLQTNVILNGQNKEQRLHLWLFVDDTPVQVLKNLSGTVPGYEFPANLAMLIRASIWDGSDWATDGGRTKHDACDLPDLWWNRGGYRDTTAEQRAAYEGVRKNHMSYDYCADKDRFPNFRWPNGWPARPGTSPIRPGLFRPAQ
ncbi:hypothetical protein SETIT_4G104800v2 [Setaria italica]|uniref:Xyloglucan endotransglucosylase/hydrolase n=1 Tax=Setaria italica TaxID=4555 RepID=A0A368QST0_SETIT|nr:hypothetical protein SETIT_4G104800v2 [Setaria italica]